MSNEHDDAGRAHIGAAASALIQSPQRPAPPARRFGPYPEEAAQDAIYARMTPESAADLIAEGERRSECASPVPETREERAE